MRNTIIVCLTILLCILVAFIVVSDNKPFTNVEEAKSEETKVDKESVRESMFVAVEKTKDFYVVYDRDTKVMYAVSGSSYSSYNRGNFTMLVNADGTPKLYKTEVNEEKKETTEDTKNE